MTAENSENLSERPNGPSWIRRLRIEELFGRHSYELKADESTGTSRLILIYGENGSGKTTILRLTYALLSPQDGRGHKTFIANVPFRRFVVEFDDGTIVEATRNAESLVGAYTLAITFAAGDTLSCSVRVSDGRVRGRENLEIDEFLSTAGGLKVAYYFLSDDRQLHSSKGEDSLLSRRTARHRRRLLAEWEDRPLGFGESHRFEALETMDQLDFWFRRQASQMVAAGDASVNTVFRDVLSRIASSTSGRQSTEVPSDGKSQARRLSDLTARNREFYELGLAAPFPGPDLAKIVETASPGKQGLINQVLDPFMDSTNARLDALQAFLDLVSLFVATVNSFFSDKELQFTMREGVTIRDASGTQLPPVSLSSGERHLLVLLGNTVMAREGASIFLIDEPELSLNVKWQRQLVNAVLKLTEGTPGQFIMATHSLELLSQYDTQVIELSRAR